MSDTVKNVLIGVGILTFIVVVTVSNRSEAQNVCPKVVRDPRVIEKYGPSPSCGFKSSGWGQTVVRVSGEKGSGMVMVEGDRISP